MGRKNIIVTNNDIDDLSSKYQNFFTKIILDAPCSGSGMFRKMDAMKDKLKSDENLMDSEVRYQIIIDNIKENIYVLWTLMILLIRII